MSSPSTPRPYSYLLGDGVSESARLKAQARLWDPVTADLLDRVDIKPGWRVLEVGPGQGSVHTMLRARTRGPIDAVEPSPAFSAAVRRASARDAFGFGRIWESPLGNTDLPSRQYDLIYARWVFLFLPEPERHLQQLVRALKPGGQLVVQDYQRDTLRMVPTPPHWDAFLAADAAFFASQGGYAGTGGLLPAMFERAGLTITHTSATIKTGHPNSDVWRWLSTYFLGVMDRLVGRAGFTKARAAALTHAWQAAARTRHALLISPAVIDVVGRKP